VCAWLSPFNREQWLPFNPYNGYHSRLRPYMVTFLTLPFGDAKKGSWIGRRLNDIYL
jgi:hypothetical protein